MTETTTDTAPATETVGGPLPLPEAAAQMLHLLQDPDGTMPDLGPATAELRAALQAAAPITAGPEGLWLAERTSEHARAARRARQELGRVSTLLGYERDRTERLRGTITAQRNRIGDLLARSSSALDRLGRADQLAVAVTRLADGWEAESGLARAGLPASGDFDSAQCYLDGATEAYVDAAKQLRELVGRPPSTKPDPYDTATVGDVIPIDDVDAPACRARKVYACSRTNDHVGQHVAQILGGQVVEVWPNDGCIEGLPFLRGTRLEAGRSAGADDDIVDACIHAEDCPGGECSCDGAQAERDAQLVANAEQLGNEISPPEAHTPPDLIDADGDRWQWHAGYSVAGTDVSLRSRDLVDASFGPLTEAAATEVPF